MIGESTQALILIRLAIFSLRAITPISFTYIALILASPLLAHVHPIFNTSFFTLSSTSILAWMARIFCLNEVWFYFWSQARIKSFAPLSKHDGLTPAERNELFKKVSATIEDPEKFMLGWFNGAPIESIGKNNMRQWILWAFFNLPSSDPDMKDISAENMKEIDVYVAELERKLGRTFPPGFNKDIKSIRLSTDPVNVIHRPACVYLGVGVLYDFLGWSRFYSLGLRHYVPSADSGHRIRYPYVGLPSKPSNSVLTYWYRPCPPLAKNEKEALPIVFIHGIGAGLKTYRDKITKILAQNPRSAIYLIETPSVTMKFMDKLPSKHEYINAVSDLLSSNNHKEALFCGHSLGTVIVSWIVHLRPEMCKRVILIDPVCWLLHLPNVAYNFLHRKPVTANHWLYWFFVSNEPGIAWFLGRGFFWFENALWLHEVPEHCEFTSFLSEKDLIVDIANVYKYLTNTTIPEGEIETVVKRHPEMRNLKTVLWRGIDHAVYLLRPGPSADVITAIHEAVASCER